MNFSEKDDGNKGISEAADAPGVTNNKQSAESKKTTIIRIKENGKIKALPSQGKIKKLWTLKN